MALDEKVDVIAASPSIEAKLPSVQSDVQRDEPVSDSEEERRLVRKIDRRILPIACLMYLFACQYFGLIAQTSSTHFTATRSDLDRSNLGNARLQGLPKDVLGGDPKGTRFDWVNSVFFLSYVGSPLSSPKHP